MSRAALSSDFDFTPDEQCVATFVKRFQSYWPQHSIEEYSDFPRNKTAAVLILLFIRDGHLRVLLTTRSKHLRSHPGQVALPGGKTDPTDASPVETALREAHEEVGLPMSSRHIHILGLLTPFLSLYKLAVTPVVAFLTDLSVLDTLRPNPDEVDEIFDHPLEAILSPGLVATIGTSPSRPLSEHGGPSWPYQSEFHDTTDAQWLHGTWYRMHRYRSTTTPIKGLTSDILILAAQIAYDRDTDYERYAKDQATFATAVEWAMEHHDAESQKSLGKRPETREIHTYGLAH
ncbi:NUDIX family hydrolase [Ceratobasidium sp. AG-Ba]|nr:NUDIX family hydrolase [Ceratobasidium sp. AG-Ba]